MSSHTERCPIYDGNRIVGIFSPDAPGVVLLGCYADVVNNNRLEDEHSFFRLPDGRVVERVQEHDRNFVPVPPGRAHFVEALEAAWELSTRGRPLPAELADVLRDSDVCMPKAPTGNGRARATRHADAALIDADTFADVLDVSRSTFDRLKSAGEILPPLRLSAQTLRWRRNEVNEWIDAGKPSPERWAAMRGKPR
jgi:predicted DNA-binding transcriptional regulator AlpA